MTIIKVITTLIGVIVSCFCCSQQINFTIKGRLNNKSTADTLYLQGYISKEVRLTNNRDFSYTGILPKEGLLLVKTNTSYAWAIWIVEGDIDVTMEEYYGESGDSTGKKLLKITSISGPVETEKYQWFIDNINALSRKFSTLPSTRRNDSVISNLYPSLEEYILNHPTSKLSAHLINLYPIGIEKKNRLLSLLNREVNIEEAKRIEKSIARENLLRTGNVIGNFEQNTIKGKIFSLKDIAKKYTLLEFWSSDCLPCRASNPELLQVYNKFYKKGFEIVGISLDDSKKEWQKAVKKDKLPWIHISDLRGWENSIATKYLVDFIPFNILIDQNKIIIGTNFNAESLSKKLDELLIN